MRKWTTRTAGLLFLATSAVYSGQLALAGAAGSANAAKQAKAPVSTVRLLDPAEPATADAPADPTVAVAEADAKAPTVAVLPPASQPSGQPAAPTSAPSKGESVTASQVAVSDTGAVEIHVNDQSLVEVLRMLSLESQKNIIASKEVRGNVTANLYGVTVREALDAILHANGYAYREKGNFIYVYSAKEMAEIEKAERKANTEVFHLSYATAANAVTMIKPVLSTDAQVSFTAPAVGGINSGGTTETGGNTLASEDVLVVTDYPDNIERVRKIIKEIDRRPQQILIEATILRASLSDDNTLGVDFNIVGGTDFSKFLTQSTNPEQVTGGSLADTNSGNVHSVGTGENFTNGTNGFRVGFVTSSAAVFLSALEQATDAVVLANPKVLALNKQKGEVIVGRKDGYKTTTVTQTSTIETVDFLETGTRLIFRPYVGDDGYIRMEIHPEDSSGGLTADSNLPFKITTEVTSNIMVKDGNTIVIGGLFREDSSSARNQVPFFGNIPVAGALFRKQRDRTVREEVIILLTPHIVKDDSAFSDASEQMLKDAEKLRVGLRKGMMPFGRERMAEWEYERAVNEMNKAHPNRDKAIWYLNCATNLNPLFTEAIDMKQALTGRELTEADNSSIRGFVRQQILADRAAAANAPASQPVEPQTPAQPELQPPATAPAQPTADQAQQENSTAADVEEAPTEPAVVQTPADKPVDEVTPATQPLTTADAPTTQPAAVEDASATAAVPTTAETPAAQPAVVTSPAEPDATVVELPATQPVSPTSKPSDAGTTVTELPTEEIDHQGAAPASQTPAGQ